MQRLGKILGIFGLFLASFFFFLYLTFPFVVLKEFVSRRGANVIEQQLALSGQTGVEVTLNMSDLDILPIPPRVRMHDVSLNLSGMGSLQLKQLDLFMMLFPFFTGDVAGEAVLHTGNGGNLVLEVYLSIADLIAQRVIPRKIEMVAEAFSLDNLAEFGLAFGGRQASPMVAPLLEALGISGKLDGRVDLNLRVNDPSQSRGEIDLRLDQAAIRLNDPSLGLKDQMFTKALVKAGIQNGSLVFDKDSGFETADLLIDLSGKIVLEQELPSSRMDLDILMQLRGDLLKNFGFLLTSFVKTSSEGKVNLQVRGPLTNPAVTAF